MTRPPARKIYAHAKLRRPRRAHGLDQVAEIPDGKSYFWIAPTVTHGGQGQRAARAAPANAPTAPNAPAPGHQPLTVDPDHRTRIPYPVLGEPRPST
ncbi:hypothetical protein ACFZCK_33615 [Kitasatospora purpeofusca]|uniref:hypothetical protein n=1 Tax=Kitasatospora purpeofusca TaxID=67352 RepID=UPI0036EE4D31